MKTITAILPDSFDSSSEPDLLLFRTKIEAIRRYLPSTDITYGIEAGVGSGLFANALGIREGVESSIYLSELACNRGVHVMTGDPEHLPYSANTLDFVFMNLSNYSPGNSLFNAFREAHRVLRNDGSFVLAFEDENIPSPELRNIYVCDPSIATPELQRSPQKILFGLTEVGFNHIDVSQTIFRFHNGELKAVIKTGYGEGQFIVISAMKTRRSNRTAMPFLS
jgi:SAM-dependent methyltransferase